MTQIRAAWPNEVEKFTLAGERGWNEIQNPSPSSGENYVRPFGWRVKRVVRLHFKVIPAKWKIICSLSLFCPAQLGLVWVHAVPMSENLFKVPRIAIIYLTQHIFCILFCPFTPSQSPRICQIS